MKSIRFAGLRIHSGTMEDSIQRCAELIEQRGHQHVVVNAAKVVASQEDPELVRIINDCALVNIDGQAVVWALRALGHDVPERVAGIDLFLELVRNANKNNWRIALLGATEDVLRKVTKILKQSNADVVYARNGYWNSEDEEQIVAEIAAHRPDILFVAIPSPKKEIFLANHLTKLDTGLTFGVGGSFDVIAGKTKRAPVRMQKFGLEWAYRLFQEPRRMFKRYLVGNTKFIALTVRQLWNQKTREK